MKLMNAIAQMMMQHKIQKKAPSESLGQPEQQESVQSENAEPVAVQDPKEKKKHAAVMASYADKKKGLNPNKMFGGKK